MLPPLPQVEMCRRVSDKFIVFALPSYESISPSSAGDSQQRFEVKRGIKAEPNIIAINSTFSHPFCELTCRSPAPPSHFLTGRTSVRPSVSRRSRRRRFQFGQLHVPAYIGLHNRARFRANERLRMSNSTSEQLCD